MGRDVPAVEFTREDRRRYREKVRASLDVLERMLAESRFDFDRPLTGLEIELNLVDADGRPAMRNAEVLGVIADDAWATEIGQFNLEINLPPRRIAEDGPGALEKEVRDALNHADDKARTIGAQLALIGILPTLRESHVGPDTISANDRYRLLNEQIFAARGEDLPIRIDGVERLDTYADSVAPEGACTSVQFHLQVSPATFGSYWNAAQAAAGAQVALGANSPYLFGHRLWAETRIPLFEQATDTRSAELKAQGVRPRVWFGERWITSVFDLFEENSRYFPALLPLTEDEDPAAVLEAGGTPSLSELTLHNGTIWRWNRPVYAVVDDRPHLRVENRVLPGGPTVVDIAANMAFYYGLIRALVDSERPVWSQMSFAAAKENFQAGARDGIHSRQYWPGAGEVPVSELVLRHLLPLASDGLDAWGVSAEERDRLLGVIEGRCLTHRTGADWQVASVEKYERSGLDRDEALRRMTVDYLDLMHSNAPAHTWPLD
ncbi:alkene reductase [Cryptosporangium phraense]|uniref:Alkene reductase n=1 Tax=Cryptosporangium phraense TaxID=2593070 RepID=A0A545APK7_9ACTN|nr:alkene reductase [Cryptosporangium phraense]TQS43252.1 alkene reductase [Cryptosporangium phraense]